MDHWVCKGVGPEAVTDKEKGDLQKWAGPNRWQWIG